MKPGICVYIIVIAAGIMFNGCSKNKKAEDQRYTWSSDAPLSIPYRVRLQRLEKANLVRNHSFETGRIFNLDSSTTSFVVDGWQQIGRHIHWVDIRNDSIYKPIEAFSGYRAIKIVRENANETDEQGEGILSDFMKVIPGNYNLSLYVRLENVFPLKARLGTKMADGVDISLQFFDRNKLPLKPDASFPHVRQVINNSFKSLSFANYSSIPSFGWGKVIGKSHHFPFSEGDIPSDAHYVKIFIGLKGVGKLWVDSVAFTYSNRNFSVSERMQQFTDTAFLTLEALIPTPKKMVKMESVFLFQPKMNTDEYPVIIVPEDLDAVGLNAARQIQSALQKCAEINGLNNGKSPVVQIVNECSVQQLKRAKLIIALGKTKFYKKYQEWLPLDMIHLHSQGYFIYSPGDFTNLVILGANSSIGLYYASLTFTQLIDSKAPVFHNTRVVDYPDFPYRFYAIESTGNDDQTSRQDAFAQELISYKLNGAFLLRSPENSHSSMSQGSGIQSSWMKNGLFSMVPLPAYRSPDDSTLTYAYPLWIGKNDRLTSPAGEQATHINFLAGTEIQNLYIPLVFHNEMLDNSDYCQVRSITVENIKYMYAGSSFFSLLTDDADIERFSSVMDANPVFMDNSMRIFTGWGQYGGNDHHYPGKMRLFNIFEPFGNDAIKEHFQKLDSDLYFINQPVMSEIDLIRLATAADFMWNAHTYSGDFALWKVLMTRYGAENARDLITYADKYGILLEAILRLDMKNQPARNFKTGQQVITELTGLVAKINESLGSQNQLVKELQSLNAGLRNKLNFYSSSVPVKK